MPHHKNWKNPKRKSKQKSRTKKPRPLQPGRGRDTGPPRRSKEQHYDRRSEM